MTDKSSTSSQQGFDAETLVINYLLKESFEILARNWKTRWCEIDIVAHKADVTYFVEVKYRNRNDWGDGLDYITPAKLKQMSFAAELYSTQHDVDVCALMAAAVNGNGAIELREIEI